jgi:hypothetical protein
LGRRRLFSHDLGLDEAAPPSLLRDCGRDEDPFEDAGEADTERGVVGV